MTILESLIRIWSVALLVGAVIPYFREQTWWLRAWTYSRLQMIFLVSVTAGLFLFIPGLSGHIDKLLFAGLIAAGLGCLADILPFTALMPKQTAGLRPGESHIPIRLLVGNVLMDNGTREDYLAQIEKMSPDIVFLVETNDAWRTALSTLEDAYPYCYLLPLANFNGMLFYSRFPILNVQERYLVQDHIPSLTIDLDVGYTEPLKFYGIHPRPPRPEDDTANLDKELHFVAHEVGHETGPCIVTGDLNDVGWSSTTKKFLRTSGLKDPRLGRGLYNSYNAKNPLVRWPLDHVFHSQHFALVEMARLDAHGSDHFPIWIELGLRH